MITQTRFLLSKSLLFLIILVGILATSFQFPELAEQTFKVEILQKGKVVKMKKGVVTLKKQPFKFRITLYDTKYLDVSASHGKYFYDFPLEENIYKCEDDRFFEDCRFVSVKTGSESTFNESKTLIVGEGDYHFNWFYDAEMDWHRYDNTVIVEGTTTIAEKTIANILDVELRKSVEEESKYSYSMENIEQPIYMVFATSHYEKGMEHPEEVQREKIILRFK